MDGSSTEYGTRKGQMPEIVIITKSFSFSESIILGIYNTKTKYKSVWSIFWYEQVYMA